MGLFNRTLLVLSYVPPLLDNTRPTILREVGRRKISSEEMRGPETRWSNYNYRIDWKGTERRHYPEDKVTD